MMVDPSIVETYTVGKEGFIVALCEALGIPTIIDQSININTGRPSEIPYGVLAMVMMVNMCHDHRPIYRLWEYYRYTDLQGLFHHPITLDQINDDRLGGFLDRFYEAGCRKIFSQIAATAVTLYGIEIKNINFDTTSKVMWGSYETPEGTLGAIEIDFGHSKDKRDDKKQIKYAIGCANGLIVDAEVLSGNKDDKTYNTQTLEKIEDTLKSLNVNKSNFYYIADSALFSEENLKSANGSGIKLITRMPDNVLLAKKAIEEAVSNLMDLDTCNITNAKGESKAYSILEKTASYQGRDLKMVTCYSKELRSTKEKLIAKAVKKEEASILKISKSLSKRAFACEADAELEVTKIRSKDLKKIIYHDISFTIKTKERRRAGRPSKDAALNILEYEYYIEIQTVINNISVERQIQEGCCFVLCSNDLNINGENLLREYKTQDSVEKKFQQLKSPQFVNSIYLESLERIEAFSYLMLICMLILSLAEYVVRRGLAQDQDTIMGPGKIKMKKPTQRAIYDIFYAVRIRVICHPDKPWERSYVHPLDESLIKVMRYLEIPENTFIRGVG